jgi:tripartite ATP-independent transporter DctM subunit
MSSIIIPTIAFLFVPILASLGIHIAIVMGTVGLGLSLYFQSFEATIGMTAIASWFNIADYSIAMIPLFIFMGTICARAGIGSDAYMCFHAWLHRMRGSLAMVTVFSCAAFASLTGSSTATVATIGGISLPEMKKRGYSSSMRLGPLAAAGTLGIMIPPSIILIFYGILTEVSIGKLFIAGIVPGIITMLLFCAVIYVWALIRPGDCAISGQEEFTLAEKLRLTIKIIPIVLTFLIVMATIYLGIASPEESAAYGVTAVIFITLLMGRLSFNTFKLALADTLRITGFIMFIIMTAMLFANGIALSGFANSLEVMIKAMDAPPFMIMAAIIIIYLLLGTVLDTFGLIVLTVPVFFPVVTAIGYDPVWFGIVVTIMVETALITPPVGTNLYVAASLDPDATSMDVMIGALPFVFIELALVFLLIAFPEIVLWLPSKMY